MPDISGFLPIVSRHARVLILGSIPSIESLARQEYYGHPKNAFWPIMGALFGAAPELCYQQRTEILMDNGIAVWDVLQACNRPGSLDSNIKLATIKTNAFSDFYAKHRTIEQVFFNGAMAEMLYKKHVLPTLNQRFAYLQYLRLPSTSPAHASLRLEEKIEAWKVIKVHVVK